MRQWNGMRSDYCLCERGGRGVPLLGLGTNVNCVLEERLVRGGLDLRAFTDNGSGDVAFNVPRAQFSGWEPISGECFTM